MIIRRGLKKLAFELTQFSTPHKVTKKTKEFNGKEENFHKEKKRERGDNDLKNNRISIFYEG